MNEERRMILQMLKDGDISVDEAERLLEAIPREEELAVAGTGQMPRRIRVLVREGEKNKVNIRVPFSLARVALKMGLTFGAMGAKHADTPEEAEALRMLREIDIDEILGSLRDGEIVLPYTIVDVDDDEKGQSVLVVLE